MGSAGDTDASARELVARMSLQEKVGQLFVVEVYGRHIDEVSEMNRRLYFVDTPAQVIGKYKPGGIIYFGPSRGDNLGDRRQIATFSNDLQKAATAQDKRIPLLLSIDQEGGSNVFRLPFKLATNMPGNMALGATRSTADARLAAKVIGTELAALGINQNFAPVADVNVNPANPVIGERSFGESPELVRDLVAAQVEGYRDGGVTSVAKHFPGHGNTNVDSHFGISEVPHTRQQLDDIDLKPFAKAIRAGIDTIMTGHLVVKAIDPSGVPATMSHPVLTGVLRDKLRFEGVIITDGLDMKGASSAFPPCIAPVEALRAGADQLLLAPQMDVAYSCVLYAFSSGELPKERLDESVYRIVRLKMKRGLFDNPYVDVAAADTAVGSTANLHHANEIAERATTLVRNDARLLPLSGGPRKILLTGWSGPMKALDAMRDELIKRGQTVDLLDTETAPAPALTDKAVALAAQSDLVVVSTANASNVVLSTGRPTDPAAAQQRLVSQLVATGKPVVVCVMRNPYDVSRLPFAPTLLATYNATPASARSVVRILFGEIAPAGKLPVRILAGDSANVLYPVGHGLSFGD